MKTDDLVHLEVNDRGGWRRVASFDGKWFDYGDLEHAADGLLEMSANPKLKARIIADGATAPITIWRHEEGWVDWDSHADRQAPEATK